MTRRAFLARSYRPDTFVYNIDIVGTCNLGCVSCPVGNTPLAGESRGAQPKGFMSYERFALILDKIRRESPVARPVIALYNWGEPFLHPEVGRIIGLVRSHGLYCAVSTNLNQARYLEDVVLAEPSNIKMSLSGFTQEVYGRTHTKGRIEAVKANMRRLRELIDRHGKRIDVFVGYHDYIGNNGGELAAMELLARELGFGVRHKIARLYPLEKALPLYGADVEPEPRDQSIYDLLLVKPHEWARVANLSGSDTTCLMRDQEMALNYDGSVSLCCNVFDYTHSVAPDFLTTGHAELQALKDANPLCGPCMASGFPKSCGLDTHPQIQRIVASRASQAVPTVAERMTFHSRHVARDPAHAGRI
jgi:MoaA/NifB/PqqE/SkfB family radical SAM enzyme